MHRAYLIMYVKQKKKQKNTKRKQKYVCMYLMRIFKV